MSKPARISTAPRPRKPVDVLDAPTAAQWLVEVDPTLATIFDQVEERLKRAQDEERDAHPPVDWDAEQDRLAEEQIALLIAGGKMIDALMDLGELSVHVARQAAGMDAAEMMANAGLRMPQQPRALLPPPSDDCGHSDYCGPADDDGDDTDRLHAIRDNTRNTTDPEAETAEIVKAVPARPRASDGQGLKWWARISMVATTVSAALTGLALAGVTLAQWAIS